MLQAHRARIGRMSGFFTRLMRPHAGSLHYFFGFL